MNTRMPFAFAGMCAFAALSLSAVLPAHAQDMKSDPMMDKAMTDEEYLYSDPMAVDYPLAAPGSIHLYHFKSYRANTISTGSVSDVRDAQMRAKDAKLAMMGRHAGGNMMGERMSMRDAMKMSYYDNPFVADPAPVNYPFAAPGSLHLYSFTDYTMNKVAEGSTADRKMDKDRMKDDMVPGGSMSMREAMHMNYYDNPFMADPAPVNYPVAAPGSLHLYTYTDYTMNKMAPGSTADRKMDKDKMKDDMQPGGMKMKKDKGRK